MEVFEMLGKLVISASVMLYGTGFLLMTFLWPINDQPVSNKQKAMCFIVVMLCWYFGVGFIKTWINGD